jgi:glutamyl-tRNA reductase
MQLAIVGLNHNTAPVEVRETIAVSDENLKAAYENIFKNDRIYEAMILSTCNRVEYYIVTDDYMCNVESILAFISEQSKISSDILKKYTYIYCGEEAITHLFKVACGLDSLVLGEPQILGQVKTAFAKSKEFSSKSTYLQKIEEATFKIAKKVRTNTGISENPVSVSYAAVELAKKIFGVLEKSHALIIGAGEMCELAAKHLKTAGIKEIYVTNRTFERAKKLANEVEGISVKFEEFMEMLHKIDIIISSTGSDKFIINYEDMRNVMGFRKHKPMFIIDIAVPRDIDPKINELENIYAYDIDDLKAVVEANIKAREKEAKKALEMIEHATKDFLHWMESLKIVPIIKSLREKFENIKELELERFCSKKNISGKDMELMNELLISYMNKVLHIPLTSLKNSGKDKSKYSLPDAVKLLFDLKE